MEKIIALAVVAAVVVFAAVYALSALEQATPLRPAYL